MNCSVLVGLCFVRLVIDVFVLACVGVVCLCVGLSVYLFRLGICLVFVFGFLSLFA